MERVRYAVLLAGRNQSGEVHVHRLSSPKGTRRGRPSVSSLTDAKKKEHRKQHCHVHNIISYSIAICPTSLATLLPSAQHHRPQHCHLLNIIVDSIVISTLPSSQTHQNSIIWQIVIESHETSQNPVKPHEISWNLTEHCRTSWNLTHQLWMLPQHLFWGHFYQNFDQNH
jgi:hypothetical protein